MFLLWYATQRRAPPPLCKRPTAPLAPRPPRQGTNEPRYLRRDAIDAEALRFPQLFRHKLEAAEEGWRERAVLLEPPAGRRALLLGAAAPARG